jgi:hypothetical protein
VDGNIKVRNQLGAQCVLVKSRQSDEDETKARTKEKRGGGAEQVMERRQGREVDRWEGTAVF